MAGRGWMSEPVNLHKPGSGFSFIYMNRNEEERRRSSDSWWILLYISCQASPPSVSRWSGFLLCAVAMLLVIFPMFAFPKKLPPRHKKKKRRKKLSLDDMSSDDDVLKEKSNNKSQTVTSSMGFGKDIKGRGRTDDVRLYPSLPKL